MDGVVHRWRNPPDASSRCELRLGHNFVRQGQSSQQWTPGNEPGTSTDSCDRRWYRLYNDSNCPRYNHYRDRHDIGHSNYHALNFDNDGNNDRHRGDRNNDRHRGNQHCD